MITRSPSITFKKQNNVLNVSTVQNLHGLNHVIDFGNSIIIGRGNHHTRETLELWHIVKTVEADNRHVHSRRNITFFQTNIYFSTFGILPNILLTCIFIYANYSLLFSFHFITIFHPLKTVDWLSEAQRILQGHPTTESFQRRPSV